MINSKDITGWESFDAADYQISEERSSKTQPHWPDRFPKPEDCAKHVWEALGDENKYWDLETACMRAIINKKDAEGLFEWAKANGGKMNDAAVLAVGRALFRPKLKSTRGKNDQRNLTLRHITFILHNQYKMKKVDVPAFLCKHLVLRIAENTVADIIK